MGYFTPEAITKTLPKIVGHLEAGEEVLIFRAPDCGELPILPQTDYGIRDALLRKFATKTLYWENIVLVSAEKIYDLTLSRPHAEVISKVIAQVSRIRSRFPSLLHWEDMEYFRGRLPHTDQSIQSYLDLSCLGCDLRRIIVTPLEYVSECGFEVVSHSYDALVDWVEALDITPVALKSDHIQLSWGKILQTKDRYFVLVINLPQTL